MRTNIREGMAKIEMGWAPDARSYVVKPNNSAYARVDQMLAWLSRNGTSIDITSNPRASTLRVFYDIMVPMDNNHVRGYLVFIPDEEEKDAE